MTTPAPTDAPAAAAEAADEAPPEVPAGVDFDMATIRRYRELRTAATASKAEADALKKEADDLERTVVEMLGEAGMQNLSVDGSTIYLHCSTYAQRAEGVDTERLKEALREAGEEALVTETVNAQTLNAYVREHLDREDPKPLPEPLRELLTLGERYSARITASSSKAKRRPAPSQRAASD